MTHRPSAELVRAILDYNPETGVFRWKTRPVEMFDATGRNGAERSCSIWNSRYAGTIAGSPDGEGYLMIRIFGRQYKAHRVAWLIMTGEWPAAEIDHRNLDKSDNRWTNLREATTSQNGANRRAQSNNTSGFKGVSWHNASGKWTARIGKNGRRIHLGYFDAPEEANAAYAAAAELIHGKFARAA